MRYFLVQSLTKTNNQNTAHFDIQEGKREVNSSFDDLKIQGVTKELIRAVHADEHRRDPTAYNNISAMEDEVATYDQEQVKILREQRQHQKEIVVSKVGKKMER